MAIRFKSGDEKGVPSGYDGPSSPEEQVIPAFGPEDTDIAFFNVFDKEISFHIQMQLFSSML